jgi:hypothetical protein
MYPDCHGVLPAVNFRSLCTPTSATSTVSSSSRAAPTSGGMCLVGLTRARRRCAQWPTLCAEGPLRQSQTSLRNCQERRESLVGRLQADVDPIDPGQQNLPGASEIAGFDVDGVEGCSIRSASARGSQRYGTQKHAQSPTTRVPFVLTVQQHPRGRVEWSGAKPKRSMSRLEEPQHVLASCAVAADANDIHCAKATEGLARGSRSMQAKHRADWGCNASKKSEACGMNLSHVQHCCRRPSVPRGGGPHLGKFEVLCGTSIPLACGCASPTRQACVWASSAGTHNDHRPSRFRTSMPDSSPDLPLSAEPS